MRHTSLSLRSLDVLSLCAVSVQQYAVIMRLDCAVVVWPTIHNLKLCSKLYFPDRHTVQLLRVLRSIYYYHANERLSFKLRVMEYGKCHGMEREFHFLKSITMGIKMSNCGSAREMEISTQEWEGMGFPQRRLSRTANDKRRSCGDRGD